MERDDEVKGEGNSYTTMFRQYDPRLGRWLTIDIEGETPCSNYKSFGNNPIAFSDINGDKIGRKSRALFNQTMAQLQVMKTQVSQAINNSGTTPAQLAALLEIKSRLDEQEGYLNDMKDDKRILYTIQVNAQVNTASPAEVRLNQFKRIKKGRVDIEINGQANLNRGMAFASVVMNQFKNEEWSFSHTNNDHTHTSGRWSDQEDFREQLEASEIWLLNVFSPTIDQDFSQVDAGILQTTNSSSLPPVGLIKQNGVDVEYPRRCATCIVPERGSSNSSIVHQPGMNQTGLSQIQTQVLQGQGMSDAIYVKDHIHRASKKELNNLAKQRSSTRIQNGQIKTGK
jgi:RHS repeat-associated protein